MTLIGKKSKHKQNQAEWLKTKGKQREKCRYADKYKAIYAPRCGCKVCEEKWKNKNV